jgi:hypothetical protein
MDAAPKRKSFCWLFRWSFWRATLLIFGGLVTLVALFYAEENWRGKHAWESYKREMVHKGVVFDYTKYVPPRVPDDQNFAMTPFFAPFFEFTPGTQQPRNTNVWQRSQQVLLPQGVNNTSDKDRWPSGKALDLVHLADALMATNRPAPHLFEAGQTPEAARAIIESLRGTDLILEELRGASHRPYSRFNVDYDWESKFGIVLLHIGPLGQICSRCELLATAELKLGQTGKAFDDVGLMFHVLNSVRNEPFLITQVLRASWLTRALQPIWEGIARHQWSESQLTEFAKELEALDFLNDGIRALRAEESFDDWFFRELRTNPNAIREADYFGPPVRDNSAREDLGPSFWVVVPRGWFYLEQLNYHRLFADEVDDSMTPKEIDPEVADRKSEIGIRLASESSRWSVLHHVALSRLLLPAVGGFEFKMARAQTYANLARIACALERCRLTQGQYPETLDALVPQFLPAVPHDVIMDQPLKYRREKNDTFILYSVGWNKKDDGGVPPAKESEERTKGDWVWEYPARSPAP